MLITLTFKNLIEKFFKSFVMPKIQILAIAIQAACRLIVRMR